MIYESSCPLNLLHPWVWPKNSLIREGDTFSVESVVVSEGDCIATFVILIFSTNGKVSLFPFLVQEGASIEFSQSFQGCCCYLCSGRGCCSGYLCCCSVPSRVSGSPGGQNSSFPLGTEKVWILPGAIAGEERRGSRWLKADDSLNQPGQAPENHIF